MLTYSIWYKLLWSKEDNNGPRLQGHIFQWNSLIYKINMDQRCFLFFKTTDTEVTRYILRTCARGVPEKCEVFWYIFHELYNNFFLMFVQKCIIGLFSAGKDNILMYIEYQLWWFYNFDTIDDAVLVG